MNETISNLIQLVRGAWRFRWWGMLAAVAVCFLGWIAVGLQEDVYEAKARVYVDTSSQLRQLLDGQIVDYDVEDQLRFVREALLGRPQLERLARETALADDVATEEALQFLITRLSKTISITSSADQNVGIRRPSNQTDDTYTISYQHNDRSLAISVVATLLDIFVKDTVGAKKTSSAATGDFVEAQIREYEKRLRIAEEDLAAFKRRNIDRLPNLQGGYFSRLQEATDSLASTRQQLELAESRLFSVEQQIRGGAPRVASTEPPDPSSLEGRIIENEARLDDLRLRYTEDHPDVIAAREIVAELRERHEQQLNEMSGSGSTGPASNNPVYQALQISKNQIETEVATLRADVDGRQRRVDELRSLINEMPEVEAELARLNRDYDVVHTQYQNLLNSLERERLTREVVESEQLEFRIIDPPAAGIDPVSPPRALLLLIVLVAGLGVGAAVTHVLNVMRPVFADASALEKWASANVLGTVDRVWSPAALRERRRSLLTFVMALGGLVAINLILVVIEVLGPGFAGLS